MADDIANQCSRVQVINDIDEVVDFSTKLEEQYDEKLGLRLVGKLLTEKPINFDVVKCTTNLFWALKLVCLFDPWTQTIYLPISPLARQEKGYGGTSLVFWTTVTSSTRNLEYDSTLRGNTKFFTFLGAFVYLTFGFCFDEKTRAIASPLWEVL